MTIAISLKVQEGVVLASDSASTVSEKQANGQSAVVNVYNNANKIVNLHKGLPLGVIVWGGGAIGPVSMTTIFKDLRAMFSGEAPAPGGADWSIDPDDYEVANVATKVREYVYENLYKAEFGKTSDPPSIGLLVAGFSSNGQHAEEYTLDLTGAGCPDPAEAHPGTLCGITVGGQPETISRLVFGVDPKMADALQKGLGVPKGQSAQAAAVLQQHLQWPIIADAMPFQDALDLATFLVDATIQMSRFLPGPATVGGPIEVAGITKHEGFKWVRRKHYFRSDLNPPKEM